MVYFITFRDFRPRIGFFFDDDDDDDDDEADIIITFDIFLSYYFILLIIIFFCSKMFHKKKNIILFFQRICDKNLPNPMGRWRIEKSDARTLSKVDLANEDHCGPCGQIKIKNAAWPQKKIRSKGNSRPDP